MSDTKSAADKLISALDQLHPRDRDFVAVYLDKDAPTYGNATQSYLATHKAKNYGSAGTSAHELLKKPKIQRAMSEILAEANAGVADRVHALARIYHGVGSRRTEQYRVDDDGEHLASVVVSEPSYTERINAVDKLSKLAGDYDHHKAEGEMAVAEYKALLRDVFGKSRDVTPKARASKVKGSK